MHQRFRKQPRLDAFQKVLDIDMRQRIISLDEHGVSPSMLPGIAISCIGYGDPDVIHIHIDTGWQCHHPPIYLDREDFSDGTVTVRIAGDTGSLIPAHDDEEQSTQWLLLLDPDDRSAVESHLNIDFESYLPPQS